eukprot:7909317-Heterocapsa_arctica.AAC.1
MADDKRTLVSGSGDVGKGCACALSGAVAHVLITNRRARPDLRAADLRAAPAPHDDPRLGVRGFGHELSGSRAAAEALQVFRLF